MIIYEINITINKILYNEYINWLNNHIKLILKNDGFIKSEKFVYDESKKTISISVHYFIKSIEQLNYYLKYNSQKMREEGVKKFPNGVNIKRRILQTLK